MASRIRIMGSPKVSLNSAQKVVGSESGIRLLPYFSLEAAASLSDSPLKCMSFSPLTYQEREERSPPLSPVIETPVYAYSK